MRILVLSHQYPRPSSLWSGVFVSEQVAALRVAGIDARVLSGQVVSPMSLRTDQIAWVNGPNNVPVAYFGYPIFPRTWRYAAGLSYATAAGHAVRTIVHDFNFDLIHAHTSFLDGYAASCLKRAFSTPVVLTEHSGPFSTQHDNLIKRVATKRALESADAVISVSNFLKSQMVGAYPSLAQRNVMIIGNGINADLFQLAEVPQDRATIEVAWVGGFLPVKQPLLMLRAFAKAWEKQKRLRLTIAGEGPLQSDMRNVVCALGIEKVVNWAGSLSRRGIADLMGKSDFIAITSETETFSLVALEALATGKPVLATRCGGPEEIINTPELGIVIEQSEAALVEGFLLMARSYRKFNPTVLHASAIKRFDYRVISEKLRVVYQSLLCVR
jgi:glycosyltransferase involved in cell wall biosynthesis